MKKAPNVRIPRWLKIQRVSLIFFLASGVLLLVYALGFITDVYLFYAYGNKGLVDFYNEMQGINSGLLWKAIYVIIFALALFLLGLKDRPAGVVTLILVALVAAAGIFFCADSLAQLMAARQQYAALDLSSLNRYIERGAITYRYSTLTYDLGFGGFGLLFCSSLFMLVTVIRNACKVRVEHE